MVKKTIILLSKRPYIFFCRSVHVKTLNNFEMCLKNTFSAQELHLKVLVMDYTLTYLTIQNCTKRVYYCIVISWNLKALKLLCAGFSF